MRIDNPKMKAAVMATGGLDSTVLLYHLVDAGYDVTAVYVDYGQIVERVELGILHHHCSVLGIPLVTLTMSFQEGTFGLTDADFVPEVVHNQDEPGYWTDPSPRYKDTHIEGRNAMMFMRAMAYCARQKVDNLYTGMYFCEREWKEQWSRRMLTADNSPGFITAMNVIAQYGLSRPVRVMAPYFDLAWNKYDIIDHGAKLGVDMSKTHSCYFPTPCGVCDNCLSREKYAAYIEKVKKKVS